MRQMILTLSMMIAAGLFGFIEGRDWSQSANVLVENLAETGQPRVVLANRGARQQKDARQDCQVPNGESSHQKTAEQESSTMKGLVF